ncbi:hypothetical protein FKM82_027970 [Ascaphus truei]
MRDAERVKKVMAAIQRGGEEKLQVISDFDMTLSRFRHNGERCPTCYNIIDNSKAVSEDCRKKVCARAACPRTLAPGAPEVRAILTWRECPLQHIMSPYNS